MVSRWHWMPITVLGILLIVGHLLSDRSWSPLHMVSKLRHSHVGNHDDLPQADTFRNSFRVALLTFGEGWHNNYHAHRQSSRHGLAGTNSVRTDMRLLSYECSDLCGV